MLIDFEHKRQIKRAKVQIRGKPGTLKRNKQSDRGIGQYTELVAMFFSNLKQKHVVVDRLDRDENNRQKTCVERKPDNDKQQTTTVT